MSTQPVTLQDVASLAGVSVSTASRALGGKSKAYRISQATTQSVLNAARQLNFHPSQVARSLRVKKTCLVGLVVPDVANPFFAAIAREITQQAMRHGYNVLLADSQGELTAESQLLTDLLARQVDGLIVCPVGLDPAPLLEADRRLPLVLIDRGFENHPFMTVTSDHFRGGQIAAQELYSAGHRQIGILQGLCTSLPSRKRLAGFQSVIAGTACKLMISGNEFSINSGEQATHEVLRHAPETTALFAFSTPQALGALNALSQLQQSVPAQISLITFDDHPFIEHLSCPLTTICQNVTELGQRAIQTLLTVISTGVKPDLLWTSVPVTLTRRKSILNLPVHSI